jgi:hypothetical protein
MLLGSWNSQKEHFCYKWESIRFKPDRRQNLRDYFNWIMVKLREKERQGEKEREREETKKEKVSRLCTIH